MQDIYLIGCHGSIVYSTYVHKIKEETNMIGQTKQTTSLQ